MLTPFSEASLCPLIAKPPFCHTERVHVCVYECVYKEGHDLYCMFWHASVYQDMSAFCVYVCIGRSVLAMYSSVS